MKTLRQFFLLLMCLSVSITSYGQANPNKLATQANKQAKNGHYLVSALYALQSLRLKPAKNKKAQQVLATSFPSAISGEEMRIEQLKASSEQFTGDITVTERTRIVEKYDSLILMHEQYKLLPPTALEAKKVNIKFEDRDYHPIRQEATEKLAQGKKDAADMHYRSGVALREVGGIDQNKTAAVEFKWAMKYIPGYEDAQLQYDEAQVAGTKRIAIIPFADKSGSGFGAIGERISDKIRDQVTHKQSAMEFTEFIPQNEIAQAFQVNSWDINGAITISNAIEIGKKLNVHEIWIGQITQAVSDGPTYTHTDLTVSGQVVVGTEKYTNSKGKVKTRNVYAERTARVRDHEKTKSVRVNGAYQVINILQEQASEREAFTKKVSASHAWREYVAGERKVSGRLGSDQQLSSHSDMLNQALDQISATLGKIIEKEATSLNIPIQTTLTNMADSQTGK